MSVGDWVVNNVWAVAVALNVTPVMLALATVTVDCVGEKAKLIFEGVTVYVPFASPLKLKLPDESVSVDAVTAPASAIVTPEPVLDGVTVPLIEYVVPVDDDPVKFTPVELALVILTVVLIGLNV
jgi:hypothetical protein